MHPRVDLHSFSTMPTLPFQHMLMTRTAISPSSDAIKKLVQFKKGSKIAPPLSTVDDVGNVIRFNFCAQISTLTGKLVLAPCMTEDMEETVKFPAGFDQASPSLLPMRLRKPFLKHGGLLSKHSPLKTCENETFAVVTFIQACADSPKPCVPLIPI